MRKLAAFAICGLGLASAGWAQAPAAQTPAPAANAQTPPPAPAPAPAPATQPSSATQSQVVFLDTPVSPLGADKDNPFATRAAGIYLAAGAKHDPALYATLIPLTSTRANYHQKYTLSIGFDPTRTAFKVKMHLSQKASIVRTKAMQTGFYFNLPTHDMSSTRKPLSDNLTSAVKNPRNFRLVRLEVKGSERVADMGRLNWLGGTKAKGKVTYSFNTEYVAPGVVFASFNPPLAAGEYAFVHALDPDDSGSDPGDEAMSTQAYDFTVE
jgi:hypothetical protein